MILLRHIAPLVLVASVLVAGCGGSGTAQATDGTVWEWTTRWTSVETNLVSADGGVIVGWNHLTGSTTISGAPVDCDFLAAVDYVGGSGTWSGFQKLTWPDGSTMVLRFDGKAVLESSGDTRFTFTGSIAGGTGVYSRATGTTSGSGVRRSALGGVVDLDVRLVLNDLAMPL